eukprot:181307-Amphidinium_carterae.1
MAIFHQSGCGMPLADAHHEEKHDGKADFDLSSIFSQYASKTETCLNYTCAFSPFLRWPLLHMGRPPNEFGSCPPGHHFDAPVDQQCQPEATCRAHQGHQGYLLVMGNALTPQVHSKPFNQKEKRSNVQEVRD